MTTRSQTIRLSGICFASLGLIVGAGCKEPIAIQPSCPAEMEVGQSGIVLSAVENPGSAARYRWEAIPSSAGVFANANAADTTFTARAPGTAFLRLTASDGLFQVISECETTIVASEDVVVAFEAEPDEVDSGDTVTLTCSDIGTPEVVEFVITQTEGETVELDEQDFGEFEFTAPDGDDVLEFECVGSDADGNESRVARVSVTVNGA